MKAFIKNSFVLAVGNYSVELFPDCDVVEVTEQQKEYIESLSKPMYNGSEFCNDLTEDAPIVPVKISSMALKLQLFDLGITDQDIFDDIDSIPDSMFSVTEKQKAKIKYQNAAKFERYNADLNLVATMEGLSQSQLDEIFINGNLLD
jgi:hypothetical protein